MTRPRVHHTPLIVDGRLIGVSLDAQPYRFTGTKGNQQYFSTACWKCGTEFQVWRQAGAPRFEPTRRCSTCATGRRARPRKPDQ